MQRYIHAALASVSTSAAAGQFDRALRDGLQIDDLQNRALIGIADARGDADVFCLDDDARWAAARWIDGLDLVRRGVQPRDGCRARLWSGCRRRRRPLRRRRKSRSVAMCLWAS